MKIFKTKKQREEEKVQKQLEADRAKFRKPDVIGQEYNRICAEAGDKQYRVKVLTSELEQINQQLFKLNQEFHRASQVHTRTEEEKKAIVDSSAAPKALNQAATEPQEKPNETIAH